MVGLLTAACSGAAEEAIREPASAPRDVSLTSSEAAPPAGVPVEVVNKWGVTSVERYFDIDHRQTSDAPYGPLTGSQTVLELPLNTWIEGSQAIVVARVITISPPLLQLSGWRILAGAIIGSRTVYSSGHYHRC